MENKQNSIPPCVVKHFVFGTSMDVASRGAADVTSANNTVDYLTEQTNIDRANAKVILRCLITFLCDGNGRDSDTTLAYLVA